MELVYLWVDEYKNIKSQGFNFSPRFTCKYDDVKNELTIDENDDYIENFFGDNINVTAIVGKNGSGKSSLLEIIEDIMFSRKRTILIYKNQEQYYCRYKNNYPSIIFDKKIIYIDTENFSNNRESFYPKIIRIAHSEKIGKKYLSHYYFGEYSGLYGGRNIKRLDSYNMLQARFFVPRYINIALEYFYIFNILKNMYKFDTLRLILKNNSTKYIRKYIDDEILNFKDYGQVQSNLNGTFCVYEENEQTLALIQQDIGIPIEEVEINLYNKEREHIVSILEKIERIHRSQSSNNQITKYNKYAEFDIAVLIAFIEYYLKNTEPCKSCQLVYDELLKLEKEVEENLFIHENIIKVNKSYILGFFEKLKKQNFVFEKDNLLSLDEIIQSIKYLQTFEVTYFNGDGSPYIDIALDKDLKAQLHYIKIMQKIFFDHEFDCANEQYLRVFEYDLLNKKVGSSYETISDGEKHFIRFSIDIIYYLQTLKLWNHTPEKEQLAIFLADEPDNALHPIWKKRVIASVMEVFKNYLDMSNITLHFIYTTHSPFLLSDIPKQNIIFLDTYENGKCKVLTHDEVFDKKQTFGQNIHTLLSDSFFMEDGLMGEFAKGKINEIIVFHKEVEEENKKNNSLEPLRVKYKEDKTKFWETQYIIGDEYLKQVIKNHLVNIETILLGYDAAKKEEIERLRAEADRLENLS